MELDDFIDSFCNEVRSVIAQGMANADDYPYAEFVFTDMVLAHMSDVGLTENPQACHISTTIGNQNIKLSGFSFNETMTQLDLFVTMYNSHSSATVADMNDVRSAIKSCQNFIINSRNGKIASLTNISSEARLLAKSVNDAYVLLEELRIFLITDSVVKTRNFRTVVIDNMSIKLEIIDIERLYNHLSAGKPTDELTINFSQVNNGPLPCVYVEDETDEYGYALTAIPGETLRYIYDKFGSRLVEANVRSFLSETRKANAGMRDTLLKYPDKFLAFNNGVVIVADEAGFVAGPDGGIGISWLKGMQIVNGGQTTASIYFYKKKNPGIDLTKVKVAAKIIILKSKDDLKEEEMIENISRCANTQTAVTQSDLYTNKPFHIELEKLAMSTYRPDGVSRWFYERADGSYKTMLKKEGTTPSKLKRLQNVISPVSRKITKKELALYIHVWKCKPFLACLGPEKNFIKFMKDVSESREIPNVDDFKKMIVNAIIYRSAKSIISRSFANYSPQITAYTVSLLSSKTHQKFDYSYVWKRQEISSQLLSQIALWAKTVDKLIRGKSEGLNKRYEEYCKLESCWDLIRQHEFDELPPNIPEIIGN